MIVSGSYSIAVLCCAVLVTSRAKKDFRSSNLRCIFRGVELAQFKVRSAKFAFIGIRENFDGIRVGVKFIHSFCEYLANEVEKEK